MHPRKLAAGMAMAFTSTSATTGCVSASLDDFAGVQPELALEQYFLGETTAYGVFEDRFGKVRRQFKVDMTGELTGNTLTLNEQFHYADGEEDTRVWTIEILGGGLYRGTANDVPDQAEGRAVGNAFNWKYKVDLPVDGNTWRVGFNDWMYLLEDDVVLNRAYVTRWGVEIGQVTIMFQKTPA